jgi:hypothetical protein
MSALGASACALPIASAWALTPTQVSVLNPINIIYVSGSTSTDAAIQAWAKLDPALDPDAPFAPLSYDLYRTATGYVLTGTARSSFGSASGQNIAIVKQTLGGSAIGIHNVTFGLAANGFPNLQSPAVFAASCGAPAPTGPSAPFQPFNTYTCSLAETTTTVNPIAPNAGISDEDPMTWMGTGGVTGQDASLLTSIPGVQVPFGIIVNIALRNALQTGEGLTTGSESPANVPSLTSAQVRAILSGEMLSLSQLYVFNPTVNQTVQVDPTASLLHICRRGDTSGAQFAANINFFGQGCFKGGGVGSITTPDNLATQANGEVWTGSAIQLGDFVFAGARTVDVLNCVAAGLGAGDTFDARLGFVSMAQVPFLANWRYVALDGVLPTIWNIQLQKYSWLTENRFNSTPTSLNLNGPPVNNHAAIFSALQTTFSDVSGLAGLNAATRNAAATADVTGNSDTGLVTLGNTVLYGASDPAGPSGPAWPAAIRAIAAPGQGPNSPQSKTYPGQATNNCNGAFQADP